MVAFPLPLVLCANFVVNSVINVCKKILTHTYIHTFTLSIVYVSPKEQKTMHKTNGRWHATDIIVLCTFVVLFCFAVSPCVFFRLTLCLPVVIVVVVLIHYGFIFFLSLSLFFSLALMCVVVNRRVKVGKELALFVELW